MTKSEQLHMLQTLIYNMHVIKMYFVTELYFLFLLQEL